MLSMPKKSMPMPYPTKYHTILCPTKACLYSTIPYHAHAMPKKICSCSYNAMPHHTMLRSRKACLYSIQCHTIPYYMMPKQSMPILEHRLPAAAHPGPEENMGIFTLSVGGPKQKWEDQKMGGPKRFPVCSCTIIWSPKKYLKSAKPWSWIWSRIIALSVGGPKQSCVYPAQ